MFGLNHIYRPLNLEIAADLNHVLRFFMHRIQAFLSPFNFSFQEGNEEVKTLIKVVCFINRKLMVCFQHAIFVPRQFLEVVV